MKRILTIGSIIKEKTLFKAKMYINQQVIVSYGHTKKDAWDKIKSRCVKSRLF